MTSQPTQVLLLGSMSRSGSTLLDLLLGQLPSFASGGELRFVWQKGVLENNRCSCGEHFSDCPFWQQVGSQAFGGWSVDALEVLDFKRRFERHRSLPTVLAAERLPRVETKIAWYRDLLSRLYAAIASVSGREIVVDSSKDPPYLFLARKAPGVQFRMVHLVRDPRGVAFSWRKRVHMPDVTGANQYMPQFTMRKSTFYWMDYNLSYHLLERLGVPRTLVRYEDLVADPRAQIERIAGFVGDVLEPSALDFLSDGEARLATHHTMGGNPMRFRSRRQRLELDEEWRQALAPRVRRSIYLATWPMLLAYRYAGSRR